MNRFFSSFRYALEGLISAIKSERNMKIHVVIGLLVIIAGVYFHLTLIEWAILSLTIGGMLCAELINTAIERVVDLEIDEYHPLAKQAKDVAAAACFIFACTSVVIGLIIFVPKM